ncbi:MAG: hypothetical protein JRI97_07125 [Deltaproteobacteria bacterium]|nr:hypothetical protein [Deltaproteobacteria bacterium]
MGKHLVPAGGGRAGVEVCGNLLKLVSDNGGRTLKTFRRTGDYLLIFNPGDGTGLFIRKNKVLYGRIFLTVKDRLDRRFVNKYQSIS